MRRKARRGGGAARRGVLRGCNDLGFTTRAPGELQVVVPRAGRRRQRDVTRLLRYVTSLQLSEGPCELTISSHVKLYRHLNADTRQLKPIGTY